MTPTTHAERNAILRPMTRARRRRLRAIRARRSADPLLVELGLERVPAWRLALAFTEVGLL